MDVPIYTADEKSDEGKASKIPIRAEDRADVEDNHETHTHTE